ncbi:type II toxin-antitoxin system PemK/MazF family toxin [Enterococcus termitis]|uniref:mRNA interferase n=1 Tax=Enterococcus termitis TaxID=332950 RepID=A0A1E5H1Y8_9ENTE|nr:type II toxin-antitoxin system PemK/MazF family toxin [Enterococcus termitis]OEG18650.1 growth inhibitor PemK [Enterococcus termitis]
MIKQGDIVTINFDPSKGSEIQKRRPALVMSRNEYNLSSNLIIVCPITSTTKQRPYFLPISSEALKKDSKVNTKQVYSLDYTPEGNRNVKVIGKIEVKEFLNVAQHFMLNFNFPFF